MKWHVTFGIIIEVQARDKTQARLKAQELLHVIDLHDHLEVDTDPISVLPLDDNGDPIL